MQLKGEETLLKYRYLYKLGANIVGMVINLVTQAIIPRGLGPKAYGDFNFLTNFFNQVIGFLDAGTSTAFYTKLSQRNQDSGLVVFYVYFSTVLSLLLLGFVGISYFSGLGRFLWPDYGISLVYLAAIWGVLSWGGQVLGKIADAYALTAQAELVRICQKLLGLLLLVLMFWLAQLNLVNFFLYNYVVIAFFVIAALLILRKLAPVASYDFRPGHAMLLSYGKELYDYSSPLLLYALISMVVGVLDRWLLQVYGGSVQQGFFGLSFQIGAICFIFTSAMTPLLMRELSIAFDQGAIPRMAALFRRYAPVLFSIAAYFSCFVAVSADRVVSLFGGASFSGAALSIVIMSFYPIHQTYGQLTGSVLFAAGKTRLYGNLGIWFMIIGLPVSYALIAPTHAFGLNLGSVGLALKMVGMQLVLVNINLYFSAKLIGLPFSRYLAHQVVVIAYFTALALATTHLTGILLPLLPTLPAFLVTGGLYTLLSALGVLAVPGIIGIDRDDLRRGLNAIQRRLPKAR